MYHKQLVYLVKAVECSSIRKAAKMLGTTQPNVSTAIRALEREVGVRLLTRNNKGVFVTPEGQLFFTLAKDIVEKQEALERFYVRTEDDRPITLNIATNPSQIALTVLKTLYPEWDGKNYQVTVRNCSVMGCVESVRSMESEIGIIFITSGMYRNYLANIEENQLEYTRTSTKKCCVNVGPKNPLYDRNVIRRQELKPYPMARYIEDELSNMDFAVEKDGVGLSQHKKVFYFNSDCSILNFVAQTEAFKLGYPWCRKEYAQLGIRCIELENNEGPLELGWIKRSSQELSPPARIFIEKFESIFKDKA